MSARQIMPWLAGEAGDLTVLSVSRGRLTKLISADGVIDYDKATFFKVEALRLAGIEDLHEVLLTLSTIPHAAVIRGRQKSPSAGEIRRRSIGDYAAFAPVRRSWLMIDGDGLPAPGGVDPADPVMAGGALRRLLPAPFRRAATVIQLSAKAGLAPVELRAHAWFWLDRPLDDDEAKRLLDGAPCDLSVFSPVALHYTGAPVFVGVDDPCLDGRIALLPGEPEVQVGEIPGRARFAATEPAPAAPWTPPARGLAFKPTRHEAYMVACLRAILAAPPGDGRGRCLRVALTLFSFAKAGQLDPVDVAGRLKGAMVQRGWDPDEDNRGNTLADVNRALQWAWEHAEPRTLP